MRLSFWDRVLAALYVLLSLALCVCVALRSLGVDAIGRFYLDLTEATGYWYFIYFGFILIIVLLGVYVLRLIFARKPRKGQFVTVDSGENGKVIIAMDALEQMVRQASGDIKGVSEMKIGVEGHEDSISVLAELTARGGVHLPTVTMNLQQDIRQYVEKNCGVAVRDVTVTVGAVLPPEGGVKPARAFTAAAQEVKETHAYAVDPEAKEDEPAPIYEAPVADPAPETPADAEKVADSEEERDFYAVPKLTLGDAYEKPEAAGNEDAAPETPVGESAEADAPADQTAAAEQGQGEVPDEGSDEGSDEDDFHWMDD